MLYHYSDSQTISIHAPTRGATTVFSLACAGQFISIHAPTRGATAFNFKWSLPNLFQSTLPRGERRPKQAAPRADPDFNPRSHEGSDRRLQGDLQGAPGFQSTLPRGERRSARRRVHRSSSDFNPRSHEGSDHELCHPAHLICISIHAPTRGATLLTYLGEMS